MTPDGKTTLEGMDASGESLLAVTYRDGAILSVTSRERPPGSAAFPVISAGFIDAQVNGFDGLDVNASEPTADTIIRLTHRLAGIGVTTWTPTIVTADEGAIIARLVAIAEARRQDPATARAIPDVHLEGPFLSDQEGARGVHDATVMRPIDAAEVDRWLATGAPVGIITVSPHTDDAPGQIAGIVALGVRVAIGHTHATPDQITAAVDAGATLSTHLGNGIAGVLPRHPNALWTQLADDRLTAGFIGDGHHLPLDTIEVFLRAKTTARAYLVSDSTDIAGRAAGRYASSVGGHVELSADGRLAYPGTGYLAGSGVDLPRALRTVLGGTSLSLADALTLVTTTPAGVLPHARTGLGSLDVGAPADLVLLDPESAAVIRVIQGGQVVGPAG
ncbi:N-acetylglucosamine-6-phosphate deacetylase [Glaciihabitans sp. dw_435]|uniref:N-acetylglucosamine-6-phosphate deacetylase n=1 Tax=Glaciihabitans sp. dw_435 TaxID=2720081 RepID=UPI0021056DC3|nr:amidohydrolase family protein [Glaciihabitans sp. dw_435]